MELSVRKLVTHIEDTRIEGGRVAEVPLKMVAIGASTAGRPHARTGDRYQDMKEMESEGAA
jgi:hypothetical protein